MIILEVKVNGKVISQAGKEDLSVLNTSLSATGVLGSKSHGTIAKKVGVEFSLHVGGLSAKSNNEAGSHYRWKQQDDLSVGDIVEIGIIENNKADAPIEEFSAKENGSINKEKIQWEEAKKIYFEHKNKYEKDD